MKHPPAFMLTHSAEIIIPHGVTDWALPLDGDTIRLSRVRVERSARVSEDSADVETERRGKLFYFPYVSVPRGLGLLEMKRKADEARAELFVVFRGGKYRVSDISEYLDDDGRVFSYEVALK